MAGRIGKDAFAGALFMLFGAVGLVVGFGYPMGSASRMGPGYVPLLLSGGLVAVGLVLVLRGIKSPTAVRALEWRIVLAVMGGALCFAAVERLGLAASAFLLVVVSSLAHRGWRPQQVVALALFLSAFAVVVFQKLLGIALPVWPGF